jgi:hypothetical protein
MVAFASSIGRLISAAEMNQSSTTRKTSGVRHRQQTG